MTQLLRFPSSVRRDPAIEAWMNEHSGPLGAIAQYWFDVMRDCGEDVRELLHDGHPTACVADGAFAYVNAFTAHVNVGFFRGAERSLSSACRRACGRPGRVRLAEHSCVDRGNGTAPRASIWPEGLVERGAVPSGPPRLGSGPSTLLISSSDGRVHTPPKRGFPDLRRLAPRQRVHRSRAYKPSKLLGGP